MQLKESTRKYILLGIVAIIIVGILSAKVMGKKQDEVFASEDILYQQVTQLYSEGNYEQASTFASKLLLEQPKSEVVNYLGAIIAASNNDFTQAAILMQKTMDLNPYKVEDAMFMLQFGEILYFAERYEDAKIVLVRCQESGWAPEQYPTYQERVTELLTLIENM